MAIDREKVLTAAQKYVEKKKYDRAVIEYQRVVQEDPNDARTLLKIGDLQSKMEAYAEAVGTYERVGKFYASQGFALKAIAVYKQIREIIAKHVPQLEETYAHIPPKLAELYQQLGLTSDALAALDEVATRLQRQGREADAIEVFRKIVDLDPTNPLPHLRLADALARGKDIEGAVAELATAAAQLMKLGRRDDALKVIDRLLAHKADPHHARTAAELFLARNAANDGMQALAKLQICFQANPHDLDTLGLLASAFTHIGQAAKAVEVQKEMARIARDTGKIPLFYELLAKLQTLAPTDETVRRLAEGAASTPSKSPLPARSPAPPLDAMRDEATTQSEGEYEDVGDSEIQAESPEQLSHLDAPAHDHGGHETRRAPAATASDSSIDEAAEPPTSAGAHNHAMHVLADAAAFRRSRLPAKAIETLRRGLEVSPRSLEIREMLGEMLLESGQVDEAVAIMLGLAGLQVDALDGEGAARTLQDVLENDPQNTRAMEMLHELGYELVEEGEGDAMPADVQGQAHVDPQHSGAEGRASHDPNAPLPSYALEEVEDVAPRDRSEWQPAAPLAPPARAPQGAAPSPSPRGQFDAPEIDDPFDDGPLPRYPLEAPDSSAAPFELVANPDATDAVQAAGAADASTSSPDAGRAAAASGGAPELESALEEAEFFASRGLYDDARTILEEQLARLPNHPLLLERMAEIDGHEHGVQSGSGARPSPSAEEGRLADRAFDIAESLGEIDCASGAGPNEPVDVEEVFAKFKEGVAKQIGAEDAQSHYDLGVAYKEMALLDDAVREFQTAANDPKRACVCHSMIGAIHLERGDLNEAIEAFLRGLQVPERTKEQEAALCYEIGAAFEVKKVSKQALEYFQRTARLASSFRDVQDRIRKLQKVEPKQPVRAVAVGADDEFDRAFDDILAGGKLP